GRKVGGPVPFHRKAREEERTEESGETSFVNFYACTSFLTEESIVCHRNPFLETHMPSGCGRKRKASSPMRFHFSIAVIECIYSRNKPAQRHSSHGRETVCDRCLPLSVGLFHMHRSACEWVTAQACRACVSDLVRAARLLM